MQARIGHIITALSLALMLFVANTPPDFIHQFAHHQDTIDAAGRTSYSTIGHQHHHCTYLNFELDAFIYLAPLNYYSYPTQQFYNINFLFPESFIQRCIVSTSLRGPPLIA